MVKALFALAKYLTWWFIKPLVSRCCVTNLTHMLQTSSSNQTHVLVAANNISLSYLEGRIYIITLFNKSIASTHYFIKSITSSRCVEDTKDILSFTRSFMINTRSLVGCLENSDRKVIKTIPCYTSDCFKSSCLQFYDVLSECCTWLPIVSRKLSRNRHCADWTA